MDRKVIFKAILRDGSFGVCNTKTMITTFMFERRVVCTTKTGKELSSCTEEGALVLMLPEWEAEELEIKGVNFDNEEDLLEVLQYYMQEGVTAPVHVYDNKIYQNIMSRSSWNFWTDKEKPL